MFQQIVYLDRPKLQPWALQAFQQYSKEKIKVFEQDPGSEQEIVKRIGQADAVLLGFTTPLGAEVLKQCPQLRYIGLCCTYYNEEACNVDVATARERDIRLTAVKDYADEGVVEFILYHLIGLCKGWAGKRWKEEVVELHAKRLGIIGMGTLGLMLAKAASALGMDVGYYSRKRKEEAEALGFRYLPLEELLAKSDIISTHLPRNTCILGEKEFSLMRQGSVLVNTSLGPTFEPAPFLAWVKQEGNFAVIDKDGSGSLATEFEAVPSIIGTRYAAGASAEAKERLSRKVLENVREYLEERQHTQKPAT